MVAMGRPRSLGPLIALIVVLAGWAPSTGRATRAVPASKAVIATGSGIGAAQRYARGRAGTVSFAVLDAHGRMRT